MEEEEILQVEITVGNPIAIDEIQEKPTSEADVEMKEEIPSESAPPKEEEYPQVHAGDLIKQRITRSLSPPIVPSVRNVSRFIDQIYQKNLKMKEEYRPLTFNSAVQVIGSQEKSDTGNVLKRGRSVSTENMDNSELQKVLVKTIRKEKKASLLLGKKTLVECMEEETLTSDETIQMDGGEREEEISQKNEEEAAPSDDEKTLEEKVIGWMTQMDEFNGEKSEEVIAHTEFDEAGEILETKEATNKMIQREEVNEIENKEEILQENNEASPKSDDEEESDGKASTTEPVHICDVPYNADDFALEGAKSLLKDLGEIKFKGGRFDFFFHGNGHYHVVCQPYPGEEMMISLADGPEAPYDPPNPFHDIAADPVSPSEETKDQSI